MRRQLLLSLTLFCLSLTVACKGGVLGPVGQAGPIQGTPDVQGVQGLPGPAGSGTRSNFAVKADASGTASVQLPAKPTMVACYINFGDGWWHSVSNAFDGHLDAPWCAVSPTGTQWQLSLFSSSNYAGSTAGFVVIY